MSENWSSGYVTDLSYTHGFYKEMSPALLRFAAAACSVRANTRSRDKTTYCELGSGQGLTSNILAAANPDIEFYATDFNPEQIYNAQAIASAANLKNIHFFDDSFSDFDKRSDLPQFNVISLHGIYSWIAKEHRDTIIRFIERRLKPGGVVYISYNCLPGWAGSSPLRHLMRMQAERSVGSTPQRIDAALAFLDRFQEQEPRFFKATPGAKERVQRLKGVSRNYIAHEYLNADWTLFYHSDVAAELSGARLSYVGSADILDHVDSIHLTDAQQAFVKEAPDATMRETLRDYILNRQFRKDIFIRGAVSLGVPEAREEWLDTRFALVGNGSDIPMKLKGTLGEVTLQETAYKPVIAAFENAGGSITLRQVVSDKTIAGLGWNRLQRVLLTLVGAGHLQPCPGEDTNAPARKESIRRFNDVILAKARHSGDLSYLASPVTGSGVPVNRFMQLFLLAVQENSADPVAYVWNIFRQNNQKLTKDGKALETDEENIASLKERYADFQKHMPVLKRLGIA